MRIFKTIAPRTPGVSHTDAKYINISFNDGLYTATPFGHPNGWPSITFDGGYVSTTNISIAGGIATVSPEGNRSIRISLNAAIDELMRLDTVSASKYKVKYFATKIVRDTEATPLTSNERIFQYGDQGTLAGETGGWVARINTTNPGPLGSMHFSMHTAHNPLVPKPNVVQGSAAHPDPIGATPAYTNQEWLDGLSLVFAMDITDPVLPVCRVYVNGIEVVYYIGSYNTKLITSWAIPGISTQTGGNDDTSKGFVLFNQSINKYNEPNQASHLKSAQVWPIWIGEALNNAHVARIAAKLHIDPFTSPYKENP